MTQQQTDPVPVERLEELFAKAPQGEFMALMDDYMVAVQPRGSCLVNDRKVLALCATGTHAPVVTSLIAELLEHGPALLSAYRRMGEALRPFADFVTPDPSWLKDGDAISQGSPLARKQLTAGDCRRALAALPTPESRGGSDE